MTKKEKLNLILSKVDTDKKEAFISELREAKTKEDTKTEDQIASVAKRYGNRLLTGISQVRILSGAVAPV